MHKNKKSNIPAISIIMPVYNSEKYLKTAIDSVLNQSFDNFELILVDDGSKDSSGQICDDYAKIDSRVVVYHQENKGISKTRNFAMSVAKGEYLAFIDNDDIYLPDLLRDNYEIAKKYNADVVKYGVSKQFITSNGDLMRTEKAVSERLEVINKDDFKHKLKYLRSSLFLTGVWDALWKRDVICKNIKFNEEVVTGCEDEIFNLEAYNVVKKIVFNPSIYYIWHSRESHSTSNKYTLRKLEDSFVMYKIEEREAKKMFGNDSKLMREYFSERIAIWLMNNIFLFFHKGCNMNYKEKVNYIKSYKKNDILAKNLNKSTIKYLLKKRDKRVLPVWLLYHDQYFLLILLIKVYKKLVLDKKSF